MKHSYSSASQVRHLFMNQFTATGERNEAVPDRAYTQNNCGYARFEGYLPNGRNSVRSFHMGLGVRRKVDTTDASVFYSYRTPVAIILPAHKLVVFTSTCHSSFTSKHMPREYGHPHRSEWQFIYVALEDKLGVDAHTTIDDEGRITKTRYTLRMCDPNTIQFVDGRGFSTLAGPVQWRMDLVKRALEYRKKAMRARTEWTKKSAGVNAVDCLAQARIVCDLFGLKHAEELPDEATLRVIVKKQDAARKVEDKKRAEAEAKRDAEFAAAMIVAKDRWVRGETHHIPYHCSNYEDVRLRVSIGRVQTSTGAEVSLVGARRAWPVLQVMHRARVAGHACAHIEERSDFKEAFEKSFAPFPFKELTVDALTIGCTVIPWSEIVRIAPEVMSSDPEIIRGEEAVSNGD